MLTRLKLLRLQREMMETREKKMLEMREKKMVDSWENKRLSMREKKESKFASTIMIRGNNEAALKGQKARQQEGYSGSNTLILMELHQHNLQRGNRCINHSTCQLKQHAASWTTGFYFKMKLPF